MRFFKLKIFWWKLTSKRKRELINKLEAAFDRISQEEKGRLAKLFWDGMDRKLNQQVIKEFGYFLVEYQGPFDGEWKGDVVDRKDIDDAFKTFVTFQG